MFRRLGDRTMEAWSLHMLGTALIRLGPLDEARETDRRRRCASSTAFGDVAGITLVPRRLRRRSRSPTTTCPRAARLWGAARALSAAGGVGLADFVDPQFEFYGRPNARFVLDAERARALADEGRAMTLDESVAYALETDDRRARAARPRGGVR